MLIRIEKLTTKTLGKEGLDNLKVKKRRKPEAIIQIEP
jgi:hypothetical protein